MVKASKVRPLALRFGDLLRDSLGIYYVVVNMDDPELPYLQRLGKGSTPPHTVNPSDIAFHFLDDLVAPDWRIVSRDHLARDEWQVFEQGKGVKTMDKQPQEKRPVPPGLRPSTVRVTSQYLRQRGKVGMTLTREDLLQLAELIRAGRVLLKDYRDVSKNLRQAMSKLGIDTKGL